MTFQPARGALVIGLALALMLTACGPTSPDGAKEAHPANETVAERGYVAPPRVTATHRLADGRVVLTGTAAPMTRVRLASPVGAAIFAQTGRSGAWQMQIARSADVRLFGLSMSRNGRAVQAEGYLAVTPTGEVAELRAGSGASLVRRPGAGVVLLAADFDRKGGTVLSGLAPAGSLVNVMVDAASRGAASADSEGRFMLALNEPLAPGPHEIVVRDGDASAHASLEISPAQPLKTGPFSAARVAGGWRIDWLTPGGGVQSTVLFDRVGAP